MPLNNPHLIGFSLSFCIKDILRGKINEEEVLFIQSACKVRDAIDMEEVIQSYLKCYWKDFDEKAVRELVSRLHDSCRIGWANPAYRDNVCNIGWGVWLSTNNAIKPS